MENFWFNYKKGISPVKKILLIMRLSFILLLVTLLHVTATGYSQNTVVSIHANNMTLEQLFVEIEKQTDVKFLYRYENIAGKTIQVNVDNSPLSTVLNKVLSANELKFTMMENNLVVVAPAESKQQGIAVAGKVIDPDGGPMPGVNVTIKGTTQGVVTDISGKYSINVSDRQSVLVFSFIGYTTKEFPVGNQTVIDVTLDESTQEIEEVVVTALGLRREQKSLGYSTSTVTSKDLNQGASVNMLKSLQGKTTGVDILNVSSDPTSSTFVTVRGSTSISGVKDKAFLNANQPLYVLDGIPIGEGAIDRNTTIDIGNAMSRLNPNDIESITILKGASAGALYGARAGNGVIMITTKTGASAKKGTTVTVTSALTFEHIRATIPVQKDFLSGSGYHTWNSSASNGWGTSAGSEFANQNWKQWDIVEQQFFERPARSYTTEDRVKAFMETGHTNTNTVVVTGNLDKGNYRFSYENLNNKSVVPYNQTNRNTFSFNGMYKMRDNLTISSMASYGRTFSPNRDPYGGNKARSGIVQILMSMRPDVPAMSVFRDASTWVNDYHGILQNTPWITDNAPLMERNEGDNVNMNNPYYIVKEMINTFETENFFGKLELDWNVITPLTFKVRTGVEKNTMNYQQRLPYNNRDRMKGQFLIRNTMGTTINTDLIALYNQRFGDFDINAVGGFNYTFSESMNQQQDTGSAGLGRPFDYSLSAVSASQLESRYDWGPSRTQSLYATVSVGWKSMIYLDGSIRNDWYGITERKKASNYYPSISLSWLANETFDLPDWWNLAKLRGGWARTGYGIPSEVNANRYGFATSWHKVQVGKVDPYLIDPNLKPESNTTIESGFTLGFVDNRVNFDFTWFQKVHADQIGELPIVVTTGFPSMRTNIGDVTSKGIEMALNLGVIRSTDWTWNVGVNYSSAKAVITKLRDGFTEVEVGLDGNGLQKIRNDEVIGYIYGNRDYRIVEDGKFKGKPIVGNTSGSRLKVDLPDRRSFLGNTNPDFVMGFNTDLRYKRFNLNVVATFRYGGVYLSQTHKVAVNDGATFDSYYGDGSYFVGGRLGYGGLAYPQDLDMIDPGLPGVRTLLENIPTRENYPDGGYTVGVFVDPRSGKEQIDESLGDGTFEYKGQQLPYYIEQGADPYATLWKRAGSSVSEWWDDSRSRTWSATNLKIKEITLSYDIPFNITQKVGIQGAQIAFIARNIFHWNKSGVNEDPETAFQDGAGAEPGVANYNLPYVASYGFKLSVNF